MEDSISEVTPLFIKNSDFDERMTEFSVCTLIAKYIDPNELLGCQRIGGLWRIYFKTNNADLLTCNVMHNGKQIPIYDQNPFRTGADSPDETLVRITVKDLPLSVHNRCLEDYLKREGVTLASKITYARARDPTTHQLSNWFNGDRVVFTKEIKNALPRFIQIANFTCRIFHEGQETKPVLCTNCFQTNHTRSQCKLPAACKACKKPGHSPGTEPCEAYQSKPAKQTIIQDQNDPLSNTYECEIKHMGLTFNSAEQCYQYAKAIQRGQPDVANQILKSPTPQLAKSKVKLLKYSKTWTNDEKTNLMKHILEAKAAQVPEFKEALLKTARQTIVFADRHEYDWANGLTPTETSYTQKKNWPGKNLLGRLLEDLRVALSTHSSSRKASTAR